MPGRLSALFASAFFMAACSAPEAGAQSTLRPLVYIEADPSGARYVRVLERITSPFTPQRTIQRLASSPRINITNSSRTLVRDVTVSNAEYGVYISGSAPVSIENFNCIGWNGGGEIYGGAIKVNRSQPNATYIQRVFADAMEAPDSSYDRSNTDFIGVERNSAPVYVRYATGRNFGDAGFDAKSNAALMNVTIDGAHRGLRVWSGVTLTIANAIINVPTGHEQVWMQGATSRLRYYNVLWCVGSTDPSPSDPRCATSPTAIGVDGITVSRAREQMTRLSTNTLTSNAFFATQIDRIVVQYSRDGGRTWNAMASGGSAGSAPRGDTRYRIPFSLTSATYLFRAYFERNGARVGSIATVNEAGQIISV